MFNKHAIIEAFLEVNERIPTIQALSLLTIKKFIIDNFNTNQFCTRLSGGQSSSSYFQNYLEGYRWSEVRLRCLLLAMADDDYELSGISFLLFLVILEMV